MNEKDLHKYQLKAVNHILDNNYAGLFLDMGLGKTVSTLTAINILTYYELDITKTLVIAPKRVVESVWEQECYKWEHLRHLKVSKVVGNEKKRKEALRKDADIYLIGRDNVAWLCGLYGGSMLPFDFLVIDELSSFKNPQTVRFKALRKVQPSFKRVVGLTGTPAPNGLIDIWSQIYLLDRGERLGKFITKYRNVYFVPNKRNGEVIFNYKLREGAEEEIYNKISDICISMKAKDYLELPGRIDNIVYIDMPDSVKKKYENFERDQVLQLFESQPIEDGITAANAAVLCNKLLQFANGAIYDEHREVHEIHELKLDALEEILETASGKPVLLAWTFRHDMERIMKRFKKYNPRQLKTDKDVEDWNKGNIPLMMMHPASGGHGLNLQKGGHIIVWFGNTYSVELEQQFNARVDRQGQENVVVINKLVLRDTMDENVIKSQDIKTTQQNRLMEAVKARIEKYLK